VTQNDGKANVERKLEMLRLFLIGQRKRRG
jgi:hypothetical protein